MIWFLKKNGRKYLIIALAGLLFVDVTVDNIANFRGRDTGNHHVRLCDSMKSPGASDGFPSDAPGFFMSGLFLAAF